MKFDISEKDEVLLNKFEPGTQIYLLMGPDKYQLTTVRTINSSLIKTGHNSNTVLIVLKNVNIDHLLIDEYYDQSVNYFTSDFPFWRCFRTEEAAEQASKFIKVEGISEEEWELAIGHRDDDPMKDTLEECELQACCGMISNIRDVLIRCKKYSGLVKLDIDYLQELYDNHKHGLVVDSVTLNKILEQLGVKWLK